MATPIFIDFPLNKPSSYWGTPPFMETHGPGYAKQVVRDLVRHLDTNLDGNIDKNELNEKEIDEAIQRGIAGCGT